MHTRGPWYTSRKNGRVVVDAIGEKIATAAATLDPPEAWHNAKLIAAAPDLLRDAKAFVASWENGSFLLCGAEILDSLRASIRKAEGNE